MSIIRWSPLWDLMNGEMDDFGRFPSMAKNFIPAMDVYETDKDVVIKTALVGVAPEDVSVNVEKGVLTISGESKKEHEVDEKNYYRKELRSGAFFRELPLPTAVEEDSVQAEFEDGILKITCPKARPGVNKKVEIKVVKKEKK